MPAAKDERPRISSLGEWYEDLLKVDAIINGRSEALQASSLLCAKLQEREPKIVQRVRYLAAKRGITFEEMWLQLLKGNYRKLTELELKELQDLQSFTDGNDRK
ncbi:hypothetical protein [Pantanalinema sp. GBBB05]|uniref:hypothetical protein n=1 Tax=Pantanalinema sp. GBBB05 TaxID=2604139 RepID=UPI003D813EC4